MSIQTDSFGDDFKPDNRVVSAAPVSPREEAIERALLLMKQENESEVNAQYGKPILRSPFEINQKS